MGELPLDDPRWCPMETAIELCQRQIDATRFAIVDLMQAMASGKLRSKRRNRVSGIREHVNAEFWLTREGRDSMPPGPADNWAGTGSGGPILTACMHSRSENRHASASPATLAVAVRPRSSRTSRNGCRKDTASTWRQTRDWRRSCGTWPSHTCSNWQRPSTRL